MSGSCPSSQPPTTSSMQSLDVHLQRSSLQRSSLRRSSLQLALRRYSSAVRDMEQTVLLPSLLRDVAPDQAWDRQAAREAGQDLYGNYLMLKAIRNTAESGLLQMDEHKSKSHAALGKKPELLLGTDPESRFHFHLRGLFTVMSELTEETQGLTETYMRIVGASN